MDVTVIFATYNRSDILREVFQAWKEVDQCTKYRYEIICSDDESSDDTTKIVEEAAAELPIKIIYNKKGGAAKARNEALKIAKGKIVIFTGDDIFPEKDFVNRHFENYLRFGENVATLGRLEWHPDIEMNHLMHHITNIGCEQFGFVALPAYNFTDFRHFYTSNISISRKLLDSQERYFNTDFDKYGFEDIEFGYRLQKNGMQIYYDPDIVAFHHHIYAQVEKFCLRQRNAGEELVVFHHMHSDLEDKCICDIDNCMQSYFKYLKKNKKEKSILGYGVLAGVNFLKTCSKWLERSLKRKERSWKKCLCSIAYGAIFRFYLYYGTVMRIAEENAVCNHHSHLAKFTCQYLRKPYHQIYWDTGYGMNEMESRKWVCWNDDECVLEKELGKGTRELRISPLKNECIAEIYEMYLETKEGERIHLQIVWHNACKFDGQKYDFTNTNDPQIIISDIKEDYEKIVVRMRVRSMKKKSLYSTARHVAAKIFHRVRVKSEEKKEWEVEYASGQPRKIQIGIGGLDAAARNNLIQDYRDQVKVFGCDVCVSDMEHMQRGYTNYFYVPQKEPLDIVQFSQVVYTLMNAVYDYVLVSKAYTDFPEIAGKLLDDVLIYSDLLQGEKEAGWNGAARGRWLRLPSYEVENHVFNLQDKMHNVQLKEEYLLVTGDQGFQPTFRLSIRNFQYKKEKPVVFVVPVFLAVGGVERNTIETMRILKEDYDFCLITLEHHTKEQGSLHYQLKGICRYVFDLKEITEFDHYLSVLYELNEMFQPEILWLCNNSPWFELHTMQIRKIFSDTAIVAQDVYDTKVGWIEYYKNEGPKTFDRYIAITEIIRKAFIEEYGIPDKKIDVIYPLVDAEHIKKVQEENVPYEELCEKYGLSKNKKHFSFVGRLTEQKNPIRYLQMIHTVMEDRYDEYEFIMVGSGVLHEKVEEYIKANHMESEIIRIPYVKNAPEFIGMLDGLILTSEYEGLPIVSIEAMSMGTPILSTDVGDLKKFIIENDIGLIFDERISDLDNFYLFVQNMEKYAVNVEKCADKLLQFFSATNVADLYRSTFRQACEEKRR